MLTVTNKQLDTIALSLRDKTRMIVLEGPTRSSKTADLIQAFYYCVYDSNERYHAICGQNYDTLNTNILYAKDIGLMETHPELKIKKRQNGGYYIEMESSKGTKEILLASYGDASKWKKILGGSIDIFLIDECNIAHPDFINETFARQGSCDNPKTFMTLNGDNPEHFIYQEQINYCKIIGNCPASTRALMSEFQSKNGVKEGYYYKFYTMLDNPVMNEDKLRKLMSVYPVGSYYYITKLLGERGKQGALIFADYMTNDLIVDAWGKTNGRPNFDFHRYTIGVDIGETSASNVFVLTGWTKNYEQDVILSSKEFVRVGYNFKKQKLFEWLDTVVQIIPRGLIDSLAIDSAEANFIEDLREPIKLKYGIDVIGSYKATIKQRCDMGIVAFSTRRTMFDKSQIHIFNSFKQSQWAKGKEGQERLDDNSVHVDRMDATEYSQTRHMKALMRGLS